MKFLKNFLTVNDYQAYKEESTVDFLGYMQDIDKCNCDAIEVLEPFEICNTVKVTITTTEANQNVCIGGAVIKDYYKVATLTVTNKDDETIWVTNGCETVGFAESSRDGEYSYYEATGGGETLIFKTVDVNNAQVGDTLACYDYDWMVGLPLGFSEVTIDGVSLNLSEYEGYDSPHWNYDAYFYTFANVGTHELVYTLLDNEIKMYSFYELGYAVDDDDNWEILDTTVEIGNCVTTIKTGAFFDTTLTNITIPSSVTSIEKWALNDDGRGILQSITFEHEICPFADSDACSVFLNDDFSWNVNLTIYHVCNDSWDTFDSVYEQICEDEGHTICQIECAPCYRAEEQSDGTYKFYSKESGEELESRLVESTETEKRKVDGQWYECTKSYYDVKCDDEWVETSYYIWANCQECDPPIILKTVMQPQDNTLLIYCDNTGNYINLSEWEIYINGNKIDNSTISKLNRSTDAYYYVYHNDDLDNTQDYTIEYVNNSINTIFEHMFYNDYYSTLKSVEIGDGITTIDNYAFSYCQSLSSVTIASSVTTIRDYTFFQDINLTAIEIPNGVTSIGQSAFYECTNVSSVTIPESVVYIGYYGFQGVWVAIDNFHNNSSLTSNIPSVCDEITSEGICIKYNEIVHIKDNTRSVYTIPNGITSINNWVFSYSDNLTSITIPNSVTNIGNYAFYECDSLTSITYNGTKAQFTAITRGTNWHSGVPTTCVVQCTDGNISIGDI